MWNSLLCIVILLFSLSSCTQLRTEFYRDETRHLYTRACQNYQDGEYKNAQGLFEQIIILDPDYGPAYGALGNLAMINENYQKAHDYYQQALAHDPELEKELLPFILVSTTYTVRQPLIDSGVELATLYPLVMEDQLEQIDSLLQQDVPLELLARDSVSLTPGQLGEMRRKAAEVASPAAGSPTYRLFIAYLLFYGETDDLLVDQLLQSLTMANTDSTLRQQAHILRGRLAERQGDNRAAAVSYLSAVSAGLPLEEVAHHLARLYRVDIASILPPEGAATQEAAAAQNPQTVVAGTTDIESSPRSWKQQRDSSDVGLPAPRAVLIKDPE